MSRKRAFVPDDFEDVNWVSISPNPASEFFSIRNQLDVVLDFEIRNLQGVLILKSDIKGLEIKELELEAWRAGYYLAIFRKPSGASYATKLLVLK